jgi:hypothetical protein
MIKITVQKTLGYHAEETEINDKIDDLKECTIIKKGYHAEEH